MISYLIYILTYFNILKWKKRLFIENLIWDNTEYVCIFKKYKIKIYVYDLVIPQKIDLVIYKNRVLKHFNYNDNHKKLYDLLVYKNIQEYFIIPLAFKYTHDLQRKRLVKIKMLRKEVEVIDID